MRLSAGRPGGTALVVALVAALSWSSGCRPDASRAPTVRFTEVADGVEYARLLDPKPGDDRLEGHAFRIDLERAGLRVLAAGGPTVRREVSTIARSLKDVVAINGSFFDEHMRAMGVVVDQGRTISRRRIKSWGALVVDDRLAEIVSGKELKLDDPPHLVLQGQPRLVKGGRVPKLKKQVARRTAVCAERQYVTFVIATKPVDATALARFLARPLGRGGLACEDALNLDGGPSTQLFARLGDLTVNVAGGDGVPNALAAVPGLPHAAPAVATLDDGGPWLDDDVPDGGDDTGDEVAATRP